MSVANIFGYMSLARKNVRDASIPLRNLDHSFRLVPTLAETCLRLSEMDVQQGNLSGMVSTLTEGLTIEKSQYVVYFLYWLGSCELTTFKNVA